MEDLDDSDGDVEDMGETDGEETEEELVVGGSSRGSGPDDF